MITLELSSYLLEINYITLLCSANFDWCSIAQSDGVLADWLILEDNEKGNFTCYSDGQKKGRWQFFDLEIGPFFNCTLCHPTKSKCVQQRMRLLTREWTLRLW